jgi:hypothetical protein
MSGTSGHLISEALRSVGYEVLGEQFPYRKLTTVAPEVRILRFRKAEDLFFVTDGCAQHTRNSKFKYEFVLHVGAPEKYFLDLLNFSAYFHLTLRDILPCNVLEIGTAFDATLDYSHVYASVPYFLPASVNFIDFEAYTLSLTWLMPIRAFEADYIERNGADAFENKLERFGSAFFADRSNPTYLSDS